MKRKSSKTMIDITRDVTVVHLNVGAGYVSYLQGDKGKGKPKVKGIVLAKDEEK